MNFWLFLVGIGIAFLFLFRFTIVKEGTAKAVVRLGAFKKLVMAWKGYEFDENWNVVEGKKFHLGGLRFVGIWPFDRVYTYKFRWQGIKIEGGKEKVEFKEERINYILVKPDVYWTKIEGAETRPPERLPLDIEFLVTARVINPYKALFKAPPNWLENVLSRLNALFRDWVANKQLDEILEMRQQTQKLWEEFGNLDLIQKVFRKEWGISIEENGIQIRDIKLPAEYAEAAAYEKRRTLEAAGRAQEIMGTFVSGLATTLGKKIEEIQAMILADPKNFIENHREIIEMVWSGVINKLSMEERAYLRIETPGATGALGDLISLIGAWQRMPQGKTEEEKREPQGKTEEIRNGGKEKEEEEKRKSPQNLGLIGSIKEGFRFGWEFVERKQK